jgi:hypothetical protein
VIDFALRFFKLPLDVKQVGFWVCVCCVRHGIFPSFVSAA